MYKFKLKVSWEKWTGILVAFLIPTLACGNSTAPLPPNVKDIATQREHILSAISGSGDRDTVARYPRNYFPYIQTAEGQALLDIELSKRLAGGNWRDGHSNLGPALIAFVALRGDEDWYERYSAFCESNKENLPRQSVITAVGFARTERAKRFVSEQLDIAYAEAIAAAHGPWKDLSSFMHLGRVARVLVEFDQPDTSARVDEMISRLRNELPEPEYEKRVLACELEVHNIHQVADIARYMEVRNVTQGAASITGASQRVATEGGQNSDGASPSSKTNDGEWGVLSLTGIATGIIACALSVFLWFRRKRQPRAIRRV